MIMRLKSTLSAIGRYSTYLPTHVIVRLCVVSHEGQTDQTPHRDSTAGFMVYLYTETQ